MKKLLSILLAGVLVFSLTACGSKNEETAESAAPEAETQTEEAEEEAADSDETAEESTGSIDKDGEPFEIGLIQYAPHPALDAANQGFIDGLDEAGVVYTIDEQNAQGEQTTCDTIANSFVGDNKDLIFAIATPAVQAVAGKTQDIPVVFTAVTDAVEAELVDSNEAPGGNITGTSDLTPVKEQMDLLVELLPDVKTVGILYCSAEVNSEIQGNMAIEALDDLGLDHKVYTVSSLNEIQTVVESMVGEVDCIYSPTDNMIAEGMSTVSMIANDNNLPTIVGESGMVEQGGFATYGINYYELGKMAAVQAVQILTGEAVPAEIPVGYLSADECEFDYNEETAEVLGIEVNKEQ